MKLNPELLFEKSLDVKNHITDKMRQAAKDMPYTSFLNVGGKLIPCGSIYYLKISDTSFCPTITMDIIKTAVNGSIDNTREIVPGTVISFLISDGVGLLETVFSADSVRDDGDYLTISGNLRVPDMFRKCSVSLPGKSAEALACMAQQMGTGFCSNIELSDTNDAMIWVNGHNSTADFCQYISSHAYKDETSFFEAFISIDHNLYFIEYNRLFDKYAFKDDINNSFKINKLPTAQFEKVSNKNGKDAKNEELIKSSPYMLTNLNSASGWNNYIDRYTLENNPQDSISSGDRVVVEYYDRVEDKFVSEFAEVLIDHKKGMVPLNRGLIIDGQKEFEGIYDSLTFPMLDTDNHHKNFYWAQAFNELNLKSVRRSGICCEMSLNTYIKRGTAIWVEIYSSRTRTTDQSESGEASSVEAVSDNMILDYTKTSFYIVDGIDYIVDNGRLKQYVHLIRRSMIPGHDSNISIET